MNKRNKTGIPEAFAARWQRHAVVVPNVVRTIDSWLFDRRTMKQPARIERTEMVHMHDVYREKDDQGKVSKVLWHRGAKVGVA